MHRKNSRLNQSDIAYLLSMREESNVSRWEQGLRKPSIDMLLLYHLLFDTPVQSLYEKQKDNYAGALIVRMKELIEQLNLLPKSQKVTARVAFLQNAINRLTS